MKPIIGITTDGKPDDADSRTGGKLTLNWNYAQIVADHGGVPVLIPPMADMREIARCIHGWLIPGGNDLDPALWGDEVHSASKVIEPARPEGEFRLMGAIPEDLPVLGICYGCQLINVYRGGDLHQHLDDLLGHGRHAQGVLDTYQVDEDAKLADALAGTAVTGASFHHQSVRNVGRGLRVVARNEESVVEAVEATDRPWMLGVQWHPERTPDDPRTIHLIQSFIEQARQYAERAR